MIEDPEYRWIGGYHLYRSGSRTAEVVDTCTGRRRWYWVVWDGPPGDPREEAARRLAAGYELTLRLARVAITKAIAA